MSPAPNLDQSPKPKRSNPELTSQIPSNRCGAGGGDVSPELTPSVTSEPWRVPAHLPPEALSCPLCGEERWPKTEEMCARWQDPCFRCSVVFSFISRAGKIKGLWIRVVLRWSTNCSLGVGGSYFLLWEGWLGSTWDLARRFPGGQTHPKSSFTSAYVHSGRAFLP